MTAARADLHPKVAEQLDDLELDPSRPLVISDADEVLFDFMTAFEEFLTEAALYYNWESYALAGNIRRASDHGPLDREASLDLLDRFFETHTTRLELVPGAAEALAALSRRAQILVVSNLPVHRRHLRREALDRHGMTYPMVANIGPKGPIVRTLAGEFAAPVFFLDDSPIHIDSVADCANGVHRVHFVGHPRLAELVEPAAGCHHRIDSWPEAREVIEAVLEAHGF